MAVNFVHGCTPDIPDHMDYRFAPPTIVTLPEVVDLRNTNMPAIQDQGNLGSCTAHAALAAMEYMHGVQGLPEFWFSRLFAYYNARWHKKEDEGCTIRSMFYNLAHKGDCNELVWPYEINRFAQRPPAKAYSAARLDRIPRYMRLHQDRQTLQSTLVLALPIVCGIGVYPSFLTEEVAQTGIIPIPSPTERLQGGHAILLVGYTTLNAALYYIFRNSWGTGWGLQGYGFIPAVYIEDRNLSFDHWVVQLVK